MTQFGSGVRSHASEWIENHEAQIARPACLHATLESTEIVAREHFPGISFRVADVCSMAYLASMQLIISLFTTLI